MSNNDHEASYEYLCRTCGHHERKHAGYPLACVVCDSHNLLRTPLFREPKPGEYDIWARDQHIEVLKAEVERLRADVARLEGERDRLAKECDALAPCRESLRSLYDVVTRHYDDPGSPWSLGRYDYLLEAAESALREEPTDAD